MIEKPAAILVPATTSAPKPALGPPKPAAGDGGPSFGQVLRAIGDETKRGEALVERAVRAGSVGRELSPGDLIALQAGVYRWVEVVDLSSKLVDRVAQAAKTVTQGNG